jgi:hypothetical protein
MEKNKTQIHLNDDELLAFLWGQTFRVNKNDPEAVLEMYEIILTAFEQRFMKKDFFEEIMKEEK